MIIKQGPQSFVKIDESAHWYQVMPDGSVKSRHEATLRHARKEKLFASPTSVEKEIRANPQLLRWIKNEIAKAFVNNPRLPEELDQTYAERILLLADGKRDFAASRGTQIHAAIENDGTPNPIIAPFYEAYLPWHNDHIEESYHSELKMADPRIGIAGTVDRIVKHRVHGLTILDYKTQKIKDGEASFYDSFPRQLSFYANAYKHKYGVMPRIMSVVIDSEKPSRPQEKLYTEEEQYQAYQEFLCQAWLWFSSKNFWPVGKWAPSFSI